MISKRCSSVEQNLPSLSIRTLGMMRLVAARASPTPLSTYAVNSAAVHAAEPNLAWFFPRRASRAGGQPQRRRHAARRARRSAAASAAGVGATSSPCPSYDRRELVRAAECALSAGEAGLAAARRHQGDVRGPLRERSSRPRPERLARSGRDGAFRRRAPDQGRREVDPMVQEPPPGAYWTY